MIVGENPGRQEDELGRPFYEHAPAGELLTTLLARIGLRREQVYLTNSTRCFKADQEIKTTYIKACHGHLAQEIEAVGPKLIVLMGNQALKSIVGHEGITRERGKLQMINGRQYLPTIHPAAALPNRWPEYQRVIEDDLRQAVKIASRVDGELLAGLDLTVVKTAAQLTALSEEMRALDDGVLAFFDFETNGLRTPFQLALPPKPKIETLGDILAVADSLIQPVISGIALCWQPDRAYYLPLDHRNPESLPKFRLAAVELARWFLASPLPKGGQHLKFDCLWAEGYFGIRPRHVVVDTLLLSHLLDPTRGIHALEKLSLQVGLAGYGNELQDWFRQQKLSEDKQDWTTAPLDLVARKSMLDVIACCRFYELKAPLLKKRGQEDLYYKHVVPGMWPYVEMEKYGMLVDQDYLVLLEHRYQERQVEGVARMRELSPWELPEDFNFNSNDQVGKLLDRWLKKK